MFKKSLVIRTSSADLACGESPPLWEKARPRFLGSGRCENTGAASEITLPHSDDVARNHLQLKTCPAGVVLGRDSSNRSVQSPPVMREVAQGMSPGPGRVTSLAFPAGRHVFWRHLAIGRPASRQARM